MIKFMVCGSKMGVMFFVEGTIKQAKEFALYASIYYAQGIEMIDATTGEILVSVTE